MLRRGSPPKIAPWEDSAGAMRVAVGDVYSYFGDDPFMPNFYLTGWLSRDNAIALGERAYTVCLLA